LTFNYAKILLPIARLKVAEELGRDPNTEPVSNHEYIAWFADQMGRQLGLMKKLRFLHDYRVAQPECRDDSHSLGETNVTLLAEFADLDTGILTDRQSRTTLDEVLISKGDFTTLQEEFEAFHEQDVSRAKIIVTSLAVIASEGDMTISAEAAECFSQAYEKEAKAQGRNKRTQLAIERSPRIDDERTTRRSGRSEPDSIQ